MASFIPALQMNRVWMLEGVGKWKARKENERRREDVE